MSEQRNTSFRRPVKPTAKLWDSAPGPEQKYRDRKRVKQPDGPYHEYVGYGRMARAATNDLYDKLEVAAAEALQLNKVRTVTQIMAMLLRYKRGIKGRKRKTIHNDLDLFKRHVRPFIGHKPVNEVTLRGYAGDPGNSDGGQEVPHGRTRDYPAAECLAVRNAAVPC